MVTAVVALILVLLPTVAQASAGDPETAIDTAEELARHHRYREVIAALEPLAGSDDLTPETEFLLTAELGRACYHLSRYDDAYDYLRRAASLQPHDATVAVYLEAAAFLTGHEEEAAAIFDALLDSGATDLYAAITLPGEEQFRAYPPVAAALAEHAIAFPIDCRSGSALGVALGDSRDDVESTLGLPATSGRTLAARAGGQLLFAVQLDPSGSVEAILVDLDTLSRYSPYRPQLVGGPVWPASEHALIESWGPPSRTDDEDDGSKTLVWRVDGVTVAAGFAPGTTAAAVPIALQLSATTPRPGPDAHE